jgi:hypothetical protein
VLYVGSHKSRWCWPGPAPIEIVGTEGQRVVGFFVGF